MSMEITKDQQIALWAERVNDLLHSYVDALPKTGKVNAYMAGSNDPWDKHVPPSLLDIYREVETLLACHPGSRIYTGTGKSSVIKTDCSKLMVGQRVVSDFTPRDRRVIRRITRIVRGDQYGSGYSISASGGVDNMVPPIENVDGPWFFLVSDDVPMETIILTERWRRPE